MSKRLFVRLGLLLVLLSHCALVQGNELPVQASDLQVPALQKVMLDLARNAITQYLKDGSILRPPADLPAVLRRRAAVFVTIEKRGQITPRGCRGTLKPGFVNLAEEIIHNSIAACSRDRRVPPLRSAELPLCLISLTVVLRIEPITSITEHDATNNGLVARNGARIGIVLPYEGRDAATQLVWAKRKAGMAGNAHAQLQELVAIRFREDSQL